MTITYCRRETMYRIELISFHQFNIPSYPTSKYTVCGKTKLLQAEEKYLLSAKTGDMQIRGKAFPSDEGDPPFNFPFIC